jgi:hypothetical protein
VGKIPTSIENRSTARCRGIVSHVRFATTARMSEIVLGDVHVELAQEVRQRRERDPAAHEQPHQRAQQAVGNLTTPTFYVGKIPTSIENRSTARCRGIVSHVQSHDIVPSTDFRLTWEFYPHRKSAWSDFPRRLSMRRTPPRCRPRSPACCARWCGCSCAAGSRSRR